MGTCIAVSFIIQVSCSVHKLPPEVSGVAMGKLGVLSFVIQCLPFLHIARLVVPHGSKDEEPGQGQGRCSY